MTVDIAQIQHVQRACLRAVADGDWYASSEIASELGRDTRATCDSLTPLVKRGVLERRVNPLNPKGYLYRLTDDAHEALEFCDLCGEVHDSTGAALRCCADQFDDEPAAGTVSVRGPAPEIAAAHEERDAR